MSPNHQQRWTISLTFRVIVLRFLLINTALIGLMVIAALPVVIQEHDKEETLIGTSFVAIPFLMIVHHVLRLWPRRYWLVIFELLASLIEVLAVGLFCGALIFAGIELSVGVKEVEDLPIYIMQATIALVVVISSILAFLFLLWDIIRSCGRDLIRPYDFSAGLCPPGRQWGLLFGRHNTRKQFSTDNRFIRVIRGGLAILCLLAMAFLVYWNLFWDPISSTGHTASTTLKVTVSDGNFTSTMQNLVYSPLETLTAVLMVPNISNPDQYPTMDLSLTYSSSMMVPSGGGCRGGPVSMGVFSSCDLAALPVREDDMVELLATIHFSEVPSDSRLYLGMTNSIADTLANAEPIGLGPGSNLHGTSSIVVKSRLSNTKYAVFGISGHRLFAVVNVHSQAIDWLPSLPRNDNTATLRVTMQTQKEIEVEEENAEVSVIDGFAKIGGIWTLTKGVFAAVFGSTLLFELFGIKPLSVYGLIHLFRPGRASLADESGTLSPEERDRIVRVLKEHLLDIDEEKVDPSSMSQYKPFGVVPHTTHSPWGAGELV